MILRIVNATLFLSSAASIRGWVTDPSPAVIPPAKVTATDVDRNPPIIPLPPGNYSLGFEASGFNKYSHSTFAAGAARSDAARLTQSMEGRP